MTHFRVFPAVCVLALGAIGTIYVPAAKAAPASDTLVVPGQRVGKVRLGDSRAVVLRLLGKPAKTARWKSGPTQDSWFGPKPSVDKDGMEAFQRIELNVIYSGGKVVQIEFNSPAFKTPQGISIGNTLQQFRRAYAGVKPYTFMYLDEGGGGYRGHYYDARAKGIAFSFGAQDYYDARIKPELLRVHRAGYPVLADPGGQPTRPEDEIPIGRQP
jgi:hypothetical protein